MASCRYIVSDVNAAVAFYRDELGFELKQQFGPAMAIVTKGDLSLWLAGPLASASKPMPDGSKPVPGGWNRIVIQVDDDLETVVAGLREKGAKFRNEILSGPGGKQILCEDPAGNPIELFQPA
eukprot:CAMPEP_0198655654 /NCGR_PEP_ID=MMETSP1467-20131203/8493_1 /TAXON_ID=1462469 /ORGANISM="unid. sp., Strain CCMP2135" /LENGTH=122 /DNA_ID=CAMNT_0044391663 /DNA_START=41 /DNA_END=409 /DNA_ORIENTATION=+